MDVPPDEKDRVNETAIRGADPSEAGILSTLAFRSKATWGYDIDFMKRCRAELTYSPDQINSDHYRFFVCEIDGKLTGFYALQLVGGGTAELEALFVDRNFMGQGIGKALVEHARTVASESGISKVVIQGDPNAEDFYLSVGAVAAGYRESGSIPGRYLPVFNLSIEQDT
jgi:GNAT superfamily N-acetyltransferase